MMCALGFMGLATPLLTALGKPSMFHFAQLRYRGDWDPRPSAYSRFLSALDLRTSIYTSHERVTLGVGDSRLFDYPFLYMAGAGAFEPFSDSERGRLGRHLGLGGTLLVDDASGRDGSPFYESVVRELSHVLPGARVERLGPGHVVYRTFYMLGLASGRKLVSPHLEGITFHEEARTPVIISHNDLGGAWAEDEFGRWRYACIPGGEPQRETAFRTGVNIVMYALTGNYKKDKVHKPFLRRRQRSL